MTSFRSAINSLTNQTGFTIKKQVAYNGLQLISKYQQQLSDYLKYTTKIDSNGDIDVMVQPDQQLTEQQVQPAQLSQPSREHYKFYVICK